MFRSKKRPSHTYNFGKGNRKTPIGAIHPKTGVGGGYCIAKYGEVGRFPTPTERNGELYQNNIGAQIEVAPR